MTVKRNKHHYVPRFYLDYWQAPDKKYAYFHDLDSEKIISVNPRNHLLIHDYYENPDLFEPNEVETLLSKVEQDASQLLRDLVRVLTSCGPLSKNARLAGDLKNFLTTKAQMKLLEFFTYQYLRVPGANEQKNFEALGLPVSEKVRTEHLHPGMMTVEGFNYTMPRLMKNMSMTLSVAINSSYLTSDRPGFDFQPGMYAPQLGVEIGRSEWVIGMMPLHPLLLISWYHKSSPYFSKDFPQPLVDFSDPQQTLLSNLAIVRHAQKYVVSKSKDASIFRLRTQNGFFSTDPFFLP